MIAFLATSQRMQTRPASDLFPELGEPPVRVELSDYERGYRRGQWECKTVLGVVLFVVGLVIGRLL